MQGSTQCGSRDSGQKPKGTIIVTFENEPEVSTKDSKYELLLEVIGNKPGNNNEIIQDVKLVLTPLNGTVTKQDKKITTEIKQVYAGKYQPSTDEATKSVNVKYGNLKANEKHRVLVEIFLPNVTKEVSIDSLQIFCTYRNEKNVETKTNPVVFRVKRRNEPKGTQTHAKAVEVAKTELVNPKGSVISTLGPYGSQLPANFYFTLEKNESIKEITVTHGFIVDSIAFLIRKPGGKTATKSFGGKGGEHKKKVELKRGEHITQISGTYGNFEHQHNVCAIVKFLIHTNENPSGYKLCGYGYGVKNERSFSSPLPTNGPVVGFLGRHNNYIESIGVYVKKDC